MEVIRQAYARRHLQRSHGTTIFVQDYAVYKVANDDFGAAVEDAAAVVEVSLLFSRLIPNAITAYRNTKRQSVRPEELPKSSEKSRR